MSLKINKRYINGNHSKGRGRSKVRHIMLHTMVGSMDSSDRWFKNPRAQVSAHYGIGYKGEIWKWVRESDTAWHGNNLNSTSVGLEFEDKGNHRDSKRTNALYRSGAFLIEDICRRHKLPINRTTIKLHREYATDGRSCPSGLDHNRLIRTAVKIKQDKDRAAKRLAEAKKKAKQKPEVVKPAPKPIIYERFKQPRHMLIKNNGVRQWSFAGAKTWKDMLPVGNKYNTGDPFTAVGLAKHPLGGIYYMNDDSFGPDDPSKNKKFLPRFGNGINAKDLKQDNPKEHEKTNFEEIAKEHQGRYRLSRDVTAIDLEEMFDSQSFDKGQIIEIVATVVFNGMTYGIPAQSRALNCWHGVPFDAIKPVPEPEERKEDTEDDSEQAEEINRLFEEAFRHTDDGEEEPTKKESLGFRQPIVQVLGKVFAAIGWTSNKKDKENK